MDNEIVIAHFWMQHRTTLKMIPMIQYISNY